MRKSNIKKAVVATCVMAMMMGALTACGSADSSTEEKATTEATTTEATEAAAAEDETTEATEAQAASSDNAEEVQVEGRGDVVDDYAAVSKEEFEEVTGKHYTAATLATDEEVENYASTVIETIKAKNWDKLADMLDYPVNVNGSTVNDKAAFTSLVQEKGVSDDFVNKVSGLSGKDVFANGQGISLGDGDVWITDKSFDGIEQKGDSQFMIITLNGFFAG